MGSSCTEAKKLLQTQVEEVLGYERLPWCSTLIATDDGGILATSVIASPNDSDGNEQVKITADGKIYFSRDCSYFKEIEPVELVISSRGTHYEGDAADTIIDIKGCKPVPKTPLPASIDPKMVIKAREIILGTTADTGNTNQVEN